MGTRDRGHSIFFLFTGLRKVIILKKVCKLRIFSSNNCEFSIPQLACCRFIPRKL